MSLVPSTRTSPTARLPVSTVVSRVGVAPLKPIRIVKGETEKSSTAVVLFQISIHLGVVPELVSTY